MDASGSLLIKHKELDFGSGEVIGSRGSSATIYKVIWKTADKGNILVAVKLHHKNVSEREIRILKHLDHKNVIKFYGHYNKLPAKGLVMELATNGDLFTYLVEKRHGNVGAASSSVRLPRPQFAQWCFDAAYAVQYLHRKYITHKDIKSMNYLLSDDVENSYNVLKICDFGISKEAEDSESLISSYGGCTKSWAPPEVIENCKLVSQMSDIYSLCVVFWELWTCQKPWEGITDGAITNNILTGVLLVVPEDFPEVLRPMIMQCWNKRRELRCRIDEVLNYLNKFALTLNSNDYVMSWVGAREGEIADDSSVDPTITLKSLAMNRQQIQDAKGKIQSIRPISLETTEKKIRKGVLNRFTKRHVIKLKEIADKYEVELDMSNIQANEVVLRGRTTCVLDAQGEVLEFINKIHEEEREQKENELILKEVKWYYASDENEMETFEDEIVILLEKAYRKKESKVKYDATNNHTYEVDLKSMEETDLKLRRTVPVVRRDLSGFRKQSHHTGQVSSPYEGFRRINELCAEMGVAGITVKILQGDITQNDADAIVHVTSPDFDFKHGAVPRAILKVGGKSIQTECKKNMKSSTVDEVWTGPGQLKCGGICHVPNNCDLKQVLVRVLRTVEKMGKESLAFPAIGTGASTPPRESAMLILDSICSFATKQKPINLCDIRIVVFEKSMTTEFMSVMKEMEGKPLQQRNMLQKGYDYVMS